MAGRPRSETVDAALRAAALAAFAEHGLAGFTFDDVARRAGTSRSTLYRRWATREELLLDALQSWRDGLDGAATIAPDMPLSALLEVLADRVAAAFDDPANRRLLRSVLALGMEGHPIFSHYLEAVVAARRSRLTGAIVAAQRERRIDPTLDPALALDAVAGALIYTLLSGAADAPDFKAGDYCRKLFRMVGLIDS